MQKLLTDKSSCFSQNITTLILRDVPPYVPDSQFFLALFKRGWGIPDQPIMKFSSICSSEVLREVSVCCQLKILMWRPISCRDEQPTSNFVGKLSPAKNQPATTGSALLHVTKLLYTVWDSSGKLLCTACGTRKDS